MIVIDGSHGEGGGQILRTALALSLVTGQAFRIDRIRARRRKPGLLRQHLTAVQAAQTVGRAEVQGAVMGSASLVFEPGRIVAGDYCFSVGTAGSATLVLQTILPALTLAGGTSQLLLEGGTHNPMAPPFDFLEKTFLPILNRMGPRVQAALLRPGFYPAGGGQFTVAIESCSGLLPVDLLERGPVRNQRARALVSGLPPSIARRELDVVRAKLAWPETQCAIQTVTGSYGPGNALMLEMESALLTEVITAFGQRGVPAEAVADQAIRQARAYLDSGVPVGEHLADQLLIPLALAGGGNFRTLPLSLHARTNADIVRRFLPVSVQEISVGANQVEVRVGAVPG